MMKLTLWLISAFLFASQASASLIRVEVTGSATGTLIALESFDRSDPVPGSVQLGGGSFDYLDLPRDVLLDAVSSDLVETVTSSIGSFLYSPEDKRFSECSGLLARVCLFNSQSRFVPFPLTGASGEPTFDTMLNTFSMLANYANGSAGFIMTPTGFYYADDVRSGFMLGTIQYFGAFSAIDGTFDTMSVTAVPGPAALPLLFSALGAFAFLRRRRT